MTERRAFSVIELVVVVGAIAIITVGIASIFNTVGKTVASGRRVSTFTQSAAVVERQMRDDFARMTRQGPMVIRHELVDADNTGEEPDPIPLYAGEPAPRQRLRRADEIVFFVQGEFEAKREPYVGGTSSSGPNVPLRRPTGDAARVYYGHGVRFDPGAPGVGYRVPAVYDGNRLNVPNGQAGPGGSRPMEWLGRDEDNTSRLGSDVYPNKYASDWILLRHVTLLVQPGEADPALSGDVEFLDSDYQIGYMPAMDQLFHSLNVFNNTKAAQYPDRPRTLLAPGGIQKWQEPDTASSEVEIATTSLAEIKAIVTDANAMPMTILTAASPPPLYDLQSPGNSLLDGVVPPIGISANGFPTAGGGPPDSQGFNGLETLNFQHAWMRDLFPSYSSRASLPTNTRRQSFRLRAEPVPPDVLGAARVNAQPWENWQALTDQYMLGAHVLVPSCSEFLVEYSFGKIGLDGRLIWYGGTDVSGGANVPQFDYYDMADYQARDGDNVHYARVTQTSGGVSRDVAPALYSWGNRELVDYRACEWVMHFGYDDISYVPSSDSDPASMPLAWPKLIRITMYLADPRDPQYEERFEFVFETPDAAQ